jgi:predicted  nucleic acid-binding Zn-ribbon protein
MAEQKQNRSTLILLLLLLVGSVGFNIYQFKNHSTTVVEHGTQVDSLINARVDVERELAGITMELEKYRGIAGNLDSLLNDANGKMNAQEAKIRKLISGEKDLNKLNKKLKSELEELRKLRDEYLEKIRRLLI